MQEIHFTLVQLVQLDGHGSQASPVFLTPNPLLHEEHNPLEH